MTPTDTDRLTAIADRAGQLYTLPSVAMEVVRLADEETVDARALCECLQQDPALAAKVLRVVNSSLYGLPREVGSLAQAIAILGARPLKMLVLGFALPKSLFDDLTGDALRRYWTETLTTATAAREIAESGWGQLGDEALVAALMQGIGQLALVGQLGEDYTRLIESTAPGPLRPAQSVLPLEREALGFEHPELSAELVRRWGLPERFAVAIDAQSRDTLAELEGDALALAQALRLANLLTRLVAGKDLAALADLNREAEEYAGLAKRQINTLVEGLQDRVGQLSRAMAVEIDQGVDYQQTLVEAHAQLAVLSEQSAARLMGQPRPASEMDDDERLARELLTDTRRLSAAVRVFLAGGTGPRTDDPAAENPQPGQAQPGRSRPGRPHVAAASPDQTTRERLLEVVAAAAAECRRNRQGLSVAIVQLSETNGSADANVAAFRKGLQASALGADFDGARWLPLARDKTAVLLPGRDRTEAAKLLGEAADWLSATAPLELDAGVAGVATPPANFEAATLVEPAERCLSTAIAIAGPAVKSLEVF